MALDVSQSVDPLESSEFNLRVFISYSHDDGEYAEMIADALEANGITPLWDKMFIYGQGFDNLIRSFIEYSHVFVPLITESSAKRGWVHQEIGYAIAMHIPILPIVLDDALPSEMIHRLHALKLSPQELNDPEGLKKLLSLHIFESLIGDYRDPSYAVYQCAELHEERTQLMIKYTNEASRLKLMGRVRQKGGLSSFHLPEETIYHEVWEKRYGPCPKPPSHNKLQRDERIAFNKHAHEKGCRLIITDGEYLRKPLGEEAFRTRVECLLAFLREMDSTGSSPPCEVAILEDLEPSIHVTIIGDFFAAESVSGSIHKGYERTLFTRHGASIREKIEQFDQEFEERLRTRGWTAENSCTKAIEFFEKKLENCPAPTVSADQKGTGTVSNDPILSGAPEEGQLSCDQTVD